MCRTSGFPCGGDGVTGGGNGLGAAWSGGGDGTSTVRELTSVATEPSDPRLLYNVGSSEDDDAAARAGLEKPVKCTEKPCPGRTLGTGAITRVVLEGPAANPVVRAPTATTGVVPGRMTVDGPKDGEGSGVDDTTGRMESAGLGGRLRRRDNFEKFAHNVSGCITAAIRDTSSFQKLVKIQSHILQHQYYPTQKELLKSTHYNPQYSANLLGHLSLQAAR